jgi:hypothetical protein
MSRRKGELARSSAVRASRGLKTENEQSLRTGKGDYGKPIEL